MKQAKDGKGNLILLLEEYERRKRKTKQAIKQQLGKGAKRMNKTRTWWTWKEIYDKEWEEKLFKTKEEAIEDAKLNATWFEISEVCIGKCERIGQNGLGYEVREVERMILEEDE